MPTPTVPSMLATASASPNWPVWPTEGQLRPAGPDASIDPDPELLAPPLTQRGRILTVANYGAARGQMTPRGSDRANPMTEPRELEEPVPVPVPSIASREGTTLDPALDKLEKRQQNKIGSFSVRSNSPHNSTSSRSRVQSVIPATFEKLDDRAVVSEATFSALSADRLLLERLETLMRQVVREELCESLERIFECEPEPAAEPIPSAPAAHAKASTQHDEGHGMLHGLAQVAHAVEAGAVHVAHEAAHVVHVAEESVVHRKSGIRGCSSESLVEESVSPTGLGRPVNGRINSDRAWVGLVQRNLHGRALDLFERMLEFDPKEPERNGCFAAAVQSKYFDTLSALVIALNTVFIFFAMNWEIDNIGQQQPPLMRTAELFFLIAYSVELGCQLVVNREFFFIGDHKLWNLFDLFLVIVSLDSYLLHATGGTRNVTFLRILRIMKMAKFLRIIRLMHVFRDLRLIMNSLMGSLMSLFWSIVAMALIFYMFGLVFVQGTTVYFGEQGSDLDPQEEENLRGAFGSVQMSMITLFMASSGGDDWSVFYDLLIPTGSAWIFLFFVCFNHIALVNILTGLFVERAMKLAEPDREAMFFEKRKAEVRQEEEIAQLVREMDESGDGIISHREFHELMFAPGSKLRHYLHTMGLARDAEVFYKTVKATNTEEDGHHHGVDLQHFVHSCMKLQGAATSLDMQFLTMQAKHMQRQLDELIRSQKQAQSQPASRALRLPSLRSGGSLRADHNVII